LTKLRLTADGIITHGSLYGLCRLFRVSRWLHVRSVGEELLQNGDWQPQLVRCRVYTRIHVAGYKLYPLVSTSCRLHVSCIGDKTVARLSPDCCLIQRNTSRPWHKWIVIMSPRYSLQVGKYLGQATCIRRHASVNTLYPDTSCSSGIHVSGRYVSWCKRGITNTIRLAWEYYLYYIDINISRTLLLVHAVVNDPTPILQSLH